MPYLDILHRALAITKNLKALKAFAKILAWQPFTSRGLLVILLSALSIKLLYLPEQDLVAGVLGGSLLALCGILCLSSILLRFRLGKTLKAETLFSANDPLSKVPIDAGIVLENSSILPYFTLEVSRKFEPLCEQSGIDSKTHLIKGREAPMSKRHLIDQVIFPHRGLWTMQSLNCKIKDALGFTSLGWQLTNNSSIEVSAPTLSIKPLPIVAASARAGDQLSQTRNRAGDLFDIRPYAPSDGIKRILWKTYARSGELVVRRPEPAIIPEGEVALYMIAGRKDDFVAGAMQHYISTLEKNQITILFGTDGLSGETDSEENQTTVDLQMKSFTTAPDQIQRLINYSAWSKLAGTGRDFAKYLESLALESRNVHQVIVFAPNNSSDNKETSADPNRVNSVSYDTLWHMRLAKAAAVHNAKLTLALVPPELSMHQIEDRFSSPTNSRVASEVKKIAKPLTDTMLTTLKSALEPKEKGAEVSTHLSGTGAEVIMVERYE